VLGLAAVLLAAALPAPASASAPSPSYAETRVRGSNPEIPAGVGVERVLSPTRTEAYAARCDELAAGYPLVPRGTTGFVADAEVTSFGRVVGRGTVDVRATVQGIESGTLKPRAIFQNRPLPGKTTPELPVRPQGYYQEFVHPTPGVSGVGPQRIVRGQGGELYYTPEHYTTFIPLN
jgi:hypothetical protein